MDLLESDIPGNNAPEYSVSEIAGAVKKTLEDGFGRVRVRGEVGRVFKARSGHLYYDLKDDKNVLACTTWKGQVAQLAVVPEEGLEVIVTGRLTSFGAQSKYNLNVDEVVVAGEGALMAMLEKRKKALAAEGLFEVSRKKALPYLPEIIGVITSPSGAVIRDILHRFRDRFPRKVLVWPVAVQGANCASEVARAIQGFNALTAGGALPRPDVIIVARGGGSIEDLWGFNEEVVARATAASDIPLISAVGHETDTTLIDFVSDQRAPTPTAAAEMAVPVRLELLAWCESVGARLVAGMSRTVDVRGQRLRDLSRALPRKEALTEPGQQRLDHLDMRLPLALKGLTASKKLELSHVSSGLSIRLLSQNLRERQRRIDERGARLAPELATRTQRAKERVISVGARLAAASPKRTLQLSGEANEGLSERMLRAIQDRLARTRDGLVALDRLRETLGYKATLERGYAVVRSEQSVITRKADASHAKTLEIEFADGRVTLGNSGMTKLKKSDGPEQGSLF